MWVALDPVEKLRHSELFQSIASELMSPDIQIHSSGKTDGAASGSAASTAPTRNGNTKYLS
jgi:hypothetical protein